MAMTGSGMGSAIYTAVLGVSVGGGQTLGDIMTASQKSEMLSSWQVIAGAIVSYIQSSAKTTILHTHVDPQGGVTAVPNVQESIL